MVGSDEREPQISDLSPIERISRLEEKVQLQEEQIAAQTERQDVQERVITAQQQTITDLLKASDLSSDPIRRAAQLSITTWSTSKLGWWGGAAIVTGLNKTLLGPAITHLWVGYDNPTTALIAETVNNIHPVIIPAIQDFAPFFIGFGLGSDVIGKFGRFIGTELTLRANKKSVLRRPYKSVVPSWVEYLHPPFLLQKTLAFVPAYRR